MSFAAAISMQTCVRYCRSIPQRQTLDTSLFNSGVKLSGCFSSLKHDICGKALPTMSLHSRNQPDTRGCKTLLRGSFRLACWIACDECS